jgi:acid stress chaperone HdeB
VILYEDPEACRRSSQWRKKCREALKMLKGRALSIVLLLLPLSTVHAQTTIDAAKITCQQFVLMKVASPEKIAIWLSGYYHGKRGSTSIDVEQLKEQAKNVRNYCIYKDKGGTLMEAVEKLMSPGK